MAVELGLEREHEVKRDALASLRVRKDARNLPEVGLLLAGRGAQRLRLDLAHSLGQDPEAAPPEDLAGVVAGLLDVPGALDEHVGDREGRIAGQRGIVAPGADPLGPDPAWDVDEDAAAVALAIDVAGAVEHLLEVGQRQLDRRPARRRVLDARRRNARTVRNLRRKPSPVSGQRRRTSREAGQTHLPGSAPSSSGRATGTREREV